MAITVTTERTNKLRSAGHTASWGKDLDDIELPVGDAESVAAIAAITAAGLMPAKVAGWGPFVVKRGGSGSYVVFQREGPR